MPTWSVVTLDPRPELGCLDPASLELGENLLGEGSEPSSGEDHLELLLQVLGWLIAKDRHMPNPVKVETVGRQLALRRCKKKVLSLAIRSGCQFLATEAGDGEIPRLGCLLRRGHDSLLWSGSWPHDLQRAR